MPVQFDNMITVKLVADADTPQADAEQFAGKEYVVPNDTPLATDGSGTFLGRFPGYARNVGAGWEWVMGQPTDQVMRAVNRAPGADGWVDLDCRRRVRQIFRDLRSNGVPGPHLVTWAAELYAAIQTDVLARQAAAPAAPRGIDASQDHPVP